MENVREVINQFKNNGNKPAKAKIQVYDDEKKKIMSCKELPVLKKDDFLI